MSESVAPAAGATPPQDAQPGADVSGQAAGEADNPRGGWQNLHALFNALEDLLFIVDEEGRIVQVNRAASERLGYTDAELSGRSMSSLHPPGRWPEAAALWGNPPAPFTLPMLARDGREIPFETRVSRGMWNQRPALFCVTRDISHRERNERLLQRHDAILEAVSFAAERFLAGSDWEADLPRLLERLGRAADVSRAYVSEARRAPDGEILCERLGEWTAPGVEPRLARPAAGYIALVGSRLSRWVALFEQGLPVRGHTRELPAGERETLTAHGVLSILAMPIFMGATWWGFIGFDACHAEQDWPPSTVEALAIAARILGAGLQSKHMELSLRRSQEQAAALEQMKSDFINRAAHELRTPLSTMLLMTDLLQEGGAPAETRQYWKILRAELERQRLLVEQLLTIGRLESGAFRARLEAVDLMPVLHQALETVAPLAAARRIRLESELAAGLPPVYGDRDGLSHVLVNLLGNAIKFTPDDGAGWVCLEAGESEGGVRIQVRDNGVGIASEDLPHLFERFYRGRNAMQNGVPGSGIGLYTVKLVVEQLGGRVNIHSRLTAGTIAEVWLPAARYSS